MSRKGSPGTRPGPEGLTRPARACGELLAGGSRSLGCRGGGEQYWPRPAGRADVCPLRLKAPAPAHQSQGPPGGKGRADSRSIRAPGTAAWPPRAPRQRSERRTLADRGVTPHRGGWQRPCRDICVGACRGHRPLMCGMGQGQGLCRREKLALSPGPVSGPLGLSSASSGSTDPSPACPCPTRSRLPGGPADPGLPRVPPGGGGGVVWGGAAWEEGAAHRARDTGPRGPCLDLCHRDRVSGPCGDLHGDSDNGPMVI